MKGLLSVFILLNGSLLADQASKKLKLIELTKIQGFYESLENHMAANEKQAKESADKIIAEYRRQFPEEDEQYFTEQIKAYEEFLAATKQPLAIKKMADRWIEIYGSQLTEAEVEQLLAHYKSSIGQKHVAAEKFTARTWTMEISEWQKQIFESAAKNYAAAQKQILEKSAKRREKRNKSTPKQNKP